MLTEDDTFHFVHVVCEMVHLYLSVFAMLVYLLRLIHVHVYLRLLLHRVNLNISEISLCITALLACTILLFLCSIT